MVSASCAVPTATSVGVALDPVLFIFTVVAAIADMFALAIDESVATDPRPRLVLAVTAFARSERLLAVCATAELASTAAVPRPRFVRAVDALPPSERVLDATR